MSVFLFGVWCSHVYTIMIHVLLLDGFKCLSTLVVYFVLCSFHIRTHGNSDDFETVSFLIHSHLWRQTVRRDSSRIIMQNFNTQRWCTLLLICSDGLSYFVIWPNNHPKYIKFNCVTLLSYTRTYICIRAHTHTGSTSINFCMFWKIKGMFDSSLYAWNCA